MECGGRSSGACGGRGLKVVALRCRGLQWWRRGGRGLQVVASRWSQVAA